MKVGVLPSGHVEDLVTFLKLKNLPYELFDESQVHRNRVRGAFQRIGILDRYSSQVRALQNWIRQSGIDVVISLDNNPLVSHLARNTKIPIFVLQHGMRQTVQQTDMQVVADNVTFLSWGGSAIKEQEDHRVPFWPNSLYWTGPSRTFPVGSLRDSLAEREAVSSRFVSLGSEPTVALISQFKGAQPKELREWRDRQEAISMVAQWTGRFVRETGFQLTVAGYADTDETIKWEIDWLSKTLRCQFEFVTPRSLTSTYEVTQRSSLIIGVHSSSLWEAFGRRRRILAVNPTQQRSFNFPVSGIWSAGQSTYQTFRQQAELSIGMTDAEYDALAAPWRDYVCLWDPNESVVSRIFRVLEEHQNRDRYS